MTGDIAISSGTQDKVIEKLIKKLRKCDGETVLHILRESGWSEWVADNLRAPKLERRLAFIAEDNENLCKLLDSLPIDKELLYNKEDDRGASVNSYLSNINVAVDLDDEEPETWQFAHEKDFGMREMPLMVALCNGRRDPTSEFPDEDLSDLFLGIRGFRVVHGVPEILHLSYDEYISLKYRDGYFLYDGFYYSDVLIEPCGERIGVLNPYKIGMGGK